MEATVMRKTCLVACLACLAGLAVSFAAAASVKTETIEYKTATETVKGYLAIPQGRGKHPGIVVIHEWWGLVPWVKQQTERLAANGYVALAVDLYHGQSTTEPSQARQLMQSLPGKRALDDLEGAFNYLASRSDVEKNKIGSIGWCMGGGWSLRLAEHEPKLAACVVNYGELPASSAQIQAIHAPVLGNFGADDHGIPPAAVHSFARAMKSDGKEINVKIYPGAGHAFENPNNKQGYRPEAAQDAWRRTLVFLNTDLK
jgi:carboxymethylenebutenolidase